MSSSNSSRRRGKFYQAHRKYDVILCAGRWDFDEYTAPLILIYSGRKLPCDVTESYRLPMHRNDACTVPYSGFPVPIYGDHLSFRDSTRALPVQESPMTTIYRRKSHGSEVVRIGYDLFAEIRTLLTAGQSVVNAAIPALDLHIALLRDLIVSSGVPLVEIPPVPDGYRFLACLTHDVDHPMIRRHKFDHTIFGFLYRAILGSLVDVLRGRIPWRMLWTNWAAALKLPLVHLGLAKDYWSDIDRYVSLEERCTLILFCYSFRGTPGARLNRARRRSARAARYGAADISGQLRNLISAGCEIGLHGIDAWLDKSASQRRTGRNSPSHWHTRNWRANALAVF